MLINYFKVALRNLLNHKTFSFINIIGMTFGLTCTIIILLWIQNEFSYDQFWNDANDIYRVTCTITKLGAEARKYNDDEMPAPVAPILKKDFPEILESARVNYRLPKMVFKFEGKRFYEDKIAVADPSFFNIFSFHFIYGNPRTALSGLNNIVLTEKVAKKYFGNDMPIGKILNTKYGDFIVSGVVENIPYNTHIQFDMLYSFKILEKYASRGLNWMNWNYTTYVKLKKGTQHHDVTEKISNLIRTHVPQMHQYFKDVSLYLQPITDIHLYSNYLNDQVKDKEGHIEYIYIMAIVAFFILFIACINFINLSTARILTRAKEIGVRKVIGAGRHNIVIQFFCEPLLYVLIAFIWSLILASALLPYANNFFGENLSLNLLNGSHILLLLLLILLSSLLAGIPQALYYSSHNPIFVLKSVVQISSKKSFIRKALVVAQFVVSTGLIIATVIVYQQINFMTNKNLGFDKTDVVYIPVNGNIGKKYAVVKKYLTQNPNILNVSAKDYMPTDLITTNMIFNGNNKQYHILSEITKVDQDYFKTLGIKLLNGTNFSEKKSGSTGNYVVVDEQIVNALHLNFPIGKHIYIGNREVTIKGVVANSYFRSVKNKVLYPQTYTYLSNLSKRTTNGVIFIKITGNNLSETIAYIEKFWQTINPKYPFGYHFLDSFVDRIYNEELQMETVLNILTILVIFTTCLGLFGLATFMAERKVKEIGIRKVFGASLTQIVYLLSKSFLVLVLVANLFAWPVIFFIMKSWLHDYTFHITINLWIFILSGATAFLIALVSIGFQAIKAATANPVESLKYE